MSVRAAASASARLSTRLRIRQRVRKHKLQLPSAADAAKMHVLQAWSSSVDESVALTRRAFTGVC